MPYGNASGRKKKAPPRSKKSGKKTLDPERTTKPRMGRGLKKTGDQSGTKY